MWSWCSLFIAVVYMFICYVYIHHNQQNVFIEGFIRQWKNPIAKLLKYYLELSFEVH